MFYIYVLTEFPLPALTQINARPPKPVAPAARETASALLISNSRLTALLDRLIMIELFDNESMFSYGELQDLIPKRGGMYNSYFLKNNRFSFTLNPLFFGRFDGFW